MQFFALFFSVLVGFSALADNSRLANAVEMDDLSAVRKAIESGNASVDELVQAPPFNAPTMPIIVLAARGGAEKVAKYLIQKGANVNAKNENDETALMMAVYFDDSLGGGEGDFSKHDRIAKMLIAAGAHLENGKWWAPLAYAAYRNRHHIGAYLLEKGANVNGTAENGFTPVNTPLMMAVIPGHKQFSLMLLRKGADVKVVNKKGYTAISLAEEIKQTHILPYLKCAEKLQPGQSFQEHCE